jgi:Na+-transporting NADH:ubiquinone oxidoreductase subunit NqrC
MSQHINSLLAYQQEVRNFNERETLIYGFLVQQEDPLTDREIRDILKPSADMNFIRPRVTDLKKAGWIVEEEKKVKDPITDKLVRRVRALTPEQRIGVADTADNQMQMALAG